jgi:hypothetical protein
MEQLKAFIKELQRHHDYVISMSFYENSDCFDAGSLAGALDDLLLAHDRAMPSYLAQYRQRRGKDPFVYSLDLAGHGTALFPESKVFCLAGFSPKIFDVMRMLETDRQALIKTIEGQFI